MKKILILVVMFLLSNTYVYADIPIAGYNNAIHDRGYQEHAFDGFKRINYSHPDKPPYPQNDHSMDIKPENKTLGSFNYDGSFTSFPKNTFIQNYGGSNIYYNDNGNPIGSYRQKSNGYYVIYNNKGTRMGTYKTLEKAKMKMQQYYQN